MLENCVFSPLAPAPALATIGCFYGLEEFFVVNVEFSRNDNHVRRLAAESGPTSRLHLEIRLRKHHCYLIECVFGVNLFNF